MLREAIEAGEKSGYVKSFDPGKALRKVEPKITTNEIYLF